MMYTVIDVAKYIILFCKEHGYSISNLKLQKLLYFVQAQFLLIRNQPAFKETIEAWDFGPVVPVAYQFFKFWGNAEIPSLVAEGAKEKILESDQAVMNEILEECAPYPASRLVEITHRPTPWREAYQKNRNNIITQMSIEEYFKNN